jgi:hypothetical protein
LRKASRKTKLKDFQFVDSGRTFYCSVETPREGFAPWWWFRLDSSGTTRYAPFEASPSDTEGPVGRRIVAFYEEMLAIAARPAHQRPAWKKPEPQKAIESAPVPAPAAAD